MDAGRIQDLRDIEARLRQSGVSQAERNKLEGLRRDIRRQMENAELVEKRNMLHKARKANDQRTAAKIIESIDKEHHESTRRI